MEIKIKSFSCLLYILKIQSYVEGKADLFQELAGGHMVGLFRPAEPYAVQKLLSFAVAP